MGNAMQCKMGDDAFDDGPLGDFGDESHGGGDGGSIATRAAERGPHVEVARLKAENKEKQALIERLRNDLITADKQKESYSKEFATVEAQMAFYKQEVDRLTTEEEKFENKAKNFKSQRNDLDDRLDELERQNKKLLRFKESADDDLNQTTEEAKKWKERYNDIAAKHETQETERTDLERNLKSAEAKASDLETKFADISAKYEDAEAQRQKGKIALDRVQAELSTWNKEESEELIASLKKEKFQRDLELEELRLENAKLKKQIEINSGASEDTSNQVDVAGKLQELVYVTKQKDILTSKINEYEEEKTSLQEQVNTLKKAKLEFTNNFDDLEIEHNRMKKKQGVLEQDKNDLEELVKEKETLILEMKAKAKQVAEEVMDNELKLGKFEREQKKMNERLESMEEENAQLKAEAKEKETKIFDNELQAQKMTRELERAKEEVSELRQQHVDVTKEMEAVQMKLKTVTGKQKAWQTRYEEVTEKYEAAEKARSKARVEIEELEEKLSSWNKAEVEAEMAKTKKELLNMSMEFEDLKVENSKLQREKERATGELGDINKAAALAKEENKSAEIEALTKQKQILKAKVDEHEAAMAALNATMEELKKSKLELTSDLDELQFQHERLKKMKLTVDADYATLEEQMQGKVTEIGELKLKTKTMEDESFEAELQLDKEKRKFASMEEKMQLLESVAEELKTLKVESKEKEEKVFEAKLNEGKLTREIETLKGENESIRGKLLDLTKANEEYKLKQREEEMMKESTDNILKLQLHKAHAEVAELREELEHVKQEDNKIHTENDELKMVAEQSKAMRMELEELHKQKDMFQHMEKGELIEANMHLKRQIAVGKDELNKLQAEIIVLKSSDTQALRKSFLAVSLSNDAEDHFIKQDSHFDIQTEKALLGEMKTELNRLRKLSDINVLGPNSSGATSEHLDSLPTSYASSNVSTDDEYYDIPDIANFPQIDHLPHIPDDKPSTRDDKPQLELRSTIEPVWDMSGTFTGNPDEPLEANFFASPRRNRSKATSGREQIQTQG